MASHSASPAEVVPIVEAGIKPVLEAKLPPDCGAPAQLSPVETANAFSRWSFEFARPLLRVGAQKVLQASDLPPLPAHDHASTVSSSSQREWDRELVAAAKSAREPSLARALYRSQTFEFWAAAFHAVAEAATCVIQPLLLRYLLLWVVHGSVSSTECTGARCPANMGHGVLLVAGFVATSLVQAVTHHQLYLYTMRGGWNLRMACTGMIHAKLLRMGGGEAVSSGKAVNLISTDVMKFDNYLPNMHYVWAAPLECIAIVILVWVQVGALTTLAGCTVTLVVVLTQVKFSGILHRVRQRTAKATDLRVRSISEILSGVMTVKSFNWEKPFVKTVAELRAAEATHILCGQRIKGINLAIFFSAPALTSMLTFVVYWVTDNRLEVGTIYSVMALLNALRLALGKKFARAMETGPDAAVAIQRLQAFMLAAEAHVEHRPPSAKKFTPSGVTAAAAMVSFSKAAFAWPSVTDGDGKAAATSSAPAISGLSFTASAGTITLILGPVGAGKSSLLAAILGEIPKQAGQVEICNVGDGGSSSKIAYAAQIPWIKAATLRSNILFGQPFDEDKYQQILDVCCLRADLALLPAGDLTEIGEKGVNLSGGQKARVALARSAYASPALAVLDDPLSAVDASVARQLFHNCIRRELATNRQAAVILATHQQQFADDADLVVVLGSDGQQKGVGSASEMRAQGLLPPKTAPSADTAPSPAAAVPASEVKTAAEEGGAPVEKAAVAVVGGDDSVGKEHRLVVPEDREIGVVSRETYLSYVRAGGNGTFVTVGVLMCVGQATMMTADAWLNIWAKAEDQSDTKYVGVYIALGGATVAIGILRALLFFAAALRSSSQMHDAAFLAVVRAPLGFFSANPLGRIVNKFSSDQSQVDESLPATSFDCVQIGSICVGSVVMVCVAIPWVGLALVPLCCCFLRIRKFYISSGRELKRLEGMGKSPIFALFHGSLSGLLTIRAFRMGEATHAAFLASLEEYGKAWYWWLMANRWVGFQLDMISTVLLSITVSLGVALRQEIDAGLLGLAISYAIQLSGTFQYCIRQSAMVETQMTSCERLMYYGRAIAPEETEQQLSTYRPPPSGWPVPSGGGDADSGSATESNLALQLEGVELRYRSDMPLVLRGVSWSAKHGAKVGIVGRTGSGKSSTIMALTRLYETGPQGTMRISGVDITTLPRAQLRDAVALIAQDPHLFAGTMRFNLDPFGAHADQEIVSVLEAVQLWHFLQGQPQPQKQERSSSSSGGLEMLVEEGGANFSVGQRQLVSLARAMLKGCSIIVMDEATANVDFATDTVIQNLLREHPSFKSATVVVVAHRISTIIDSDVIVVMGDGQVVESGSPAELLAKGPVHGAFAQMHEASKAMTT